MRFKLNFIICPHCSSKLKLDEIIREFCYDMPFSKLAYVRLICPICGGVLKKKEVGR